MPALARDASGMRQSDAQGVENRRRRKWVNTQSTPPRSGSLEKGRPRTARFASQPLPAACEPRVRSRSAPPQRPHWRPPLTLMRRRMRPRRAARPHPAMAQRIRRGAEQQGPSGPTSLIRMHQLRTPMNADEPNTPCISPDRDKKLCGGHGQGERERERGTSHSPCGSFSTARECLPQPSPRLPPHPSTGPPPLFCLSAQRGMCPSPARETARKQEEDVIHG